jgi:hypothetical protein
MADEIRFLEGTDPRRPDAFYVSGTDACAAWFDSGDLP